MWQLRDRAHPVLTEEGGAILDEHTGRWTYLTPTAAAAVMLLLASTNTNQAAAQYAARYGISFQQATCDVTTVADTLTHHGLAVSHSNPARSSPSSRRLPRWWR